MLIGCDIRAAINLFKLTQAHTIQGFTPILQTLPHISCIQGCKTFRLLSDQTYQDCSNTNFVQGKYNSTSLALVYSVSLCTHNHVETPVTRRGQVPAASTAQPLGNRSTHRFNSMRARTFSPAVGCAHNRYQSR